MGLVARSARNRGGRPDKRSGASRVEVPRRTRGPRGRRERPRTRSRDRTLPWDVTSPKPRGLRFRTNGSSRGWDASRSRRLGQDDLSDRTADAICSKSAFPLDSDRLGSGSGGPSDTRQPRRSLLGCGMEPPWTRRLSIIRSPVRRRGCTGGSSVSGIAAPWSDGPLREWKNYGLACESHRDALVARATSRRESLAVRDDEQVGPVEVFELPRLAGSVNR